MPKKTSSPTLAKTSLLILALTLGLAGAGLIAAAAAAPDPAALLQEAAPLHPTFPLLDSRGENVLTSGGPLSLRMTCDGCHNTAFIEEHNQHAGLLDQAALPGQPPGIWFDIEAGQFVAWDSAAAQDLETNCLLCHAAAPNNPARLQALAAEDWDWASAATLIGSGAIDLAAGSYAWDEGGFDNEGNIISDALLIQSPQNANCALCHGMEPLNPDLPITAKPCDPRSVSTTGQVFSPQKLSDSGLDLVDKQELTRTWDAHAESILACTDCHRSSNNPAYPTIGDDGQPLHLMFDPRRLEISDYLYQPLHVLAGSEAEPLDCLACHSLDGTHDWLPYSERHFSALSCQACHVPQILTPALEQVDWTVLNPMGNPLFVCRGVQEEADRSRILAVQPALLSDGGDSSNLVPHNLTSVWSWVHGDPPTPVGYADLRAAWLQRGSYPAEILAAFDASGDGELQRDELAIRTPEQQELIAARLEALGLENPRISGEVYSFPLNHTIASDEWAVKECAECHSDDSRADLSFELAGSVPGGSTTSIAWAGAPIEGTQFSIDPEGALYLLPGEGGEDLYLPGHSRAAWVDWAGTVIFVLVLLGVAAHAALRARNRQWRKAKREYEQVYKYGVYERLWHWLQTFDIVGLLITGVIIHNPDLLSLFDYRGVVLAHNVLAAILALNAALSLFYHLVSGEIRQYLPRPAGFFDRAILQARYYLQGIFRGERHPFHSMPDRKFNPLQQVTYIAILNVLLPLQGVTGILMWAAGRWPELAVRLPFLAPFHTLIAWLFAAFIVMHVYLTTTGGPTPLSSIEGMILGWEKVGEQAIQTERGEA